MPTLKPSMFAGVLIPSYLPTNAPLSLRKSRQVLEDDSEFHKFKQVLVPSIAAVAGVAFL